MTTPQTNNVGDRQHSNKIRHSNNTSDINLSEETDGIDVDDTLTTSPEGSSIATQFIDRNTNKDLGKIKSITMNNLISSRKKSNTNSNAGRNRSVKSIDIALKDTNSKKLKKLYTKDLKKRWRYIKTEDLKKNM